VIVWCYHVMVSEADRGHITCPICVVRLGASIEVLLLHVKPEMFEKLAVS
jgi:hypothetical protein